MERRGARGVYFRLVKEPDAESKRTAFEQALARRRAGQPDSRVYEYRQGDFLIRNLLGIDGKSGAVAVGAALRTGIVVQFHLRDAETSAQDLEAVLARHHEGPAPRAAGSLLFACLGRGEQLYGEPDHDTAAFQRHLGPVPLGGFFCNGEIGPVHGSTFLHGYTSSFGLFRSRD